MESKFGASQGNAGLEQRRRRGIIRHMENLPEQVSDYVRWHPEAWALARRLVDEGLGGVFSKYLAGADEPALARFFAELAAVDLAEVIRHRSALTGGTAEATDIAPLEPKTAGDNGPRFAALGQESLRRGEWAVLIFAGGAGTRFFGAASRRSAKGLFPITPVAGRSFLEHFLAEVLAAGIRAGRLPYLVLMTSRLTHDELAEWGEGPLPQGFPRERLLLLRQGERPRLDADGDLIANADGSIVQTGDGHGGVFRALLSSGMAARLQSEGVRQLVMHNVDNIAARALDPVRLGFHLAGRQLFTLTAVERKPGERAGIICRNVRTGRVEVIEYSACPAGLAEARDSGGRLRFPLAHVNTNLVTLRALRADIPGCLYRDKLCVVSGREVKTSSWEMLNQHLCRLLEPEAVGVILVEREKFFLPTKTLAGDDSVQTTTAALARAAAARLAAQGARIDATATVELDPCLDESDGIVDAAGWQVGPGAKLFLGCRGPKFGPGLVLGEGAELRIEADRPWGKLHVDRDGSIRVEPGSAPQVRFGPDVRVEAGARVRIHVAGDGSCIVPEGYVFQGEHDIRVPAGGRADIAR